MPVVTIEHMCLFLQNVQKRQKELIGSDDNNGIKRSFRRQIFLPSPKFSEFSFLFLYQITFWLTFTHFTRYYKNILL